MVRQHCRATLSLKACWIRVWPGVIAYENRCNASHPFPTAFSPPQPPRTLIYPYPYRFHRILHPTLSDPSDLPTHFRRPSLGRRRGTLWRHSVHHTHLSHVCPTRAPGDAIRINSVLKTFFQTPVSGEEKKRRIQERISGSCFLTVFPTRIAYWYRSGGHE